MGENLISAGNRDNDEELEKKTREKSIGSSSLRLLIFIPTWRGFVNQRARVSSLVTGFTLVSLLVFSLFRPSLAVPRRMQQHQHHHHHHHHHHHYQVKPLETHEGNNDNALLHDDELETIRKSIVEGLGLERIPDPSKANVSQAEYERAHHEYMNRLQMSRAPEDRRQKRLYTFYASEQTSISTGQEIFQNDRQITYKFFFPIDISEQHSIVDYANLRLLVGSNDYQDLVGITVYQLTNSSRQLVTQEYIRRLDSPRWIELDITDMVTLWHEGSADNLGLELQLNSNIIFSNPILNIFTTLESREFRKRRSASDHLMSLHKGRRTECRGDNKKCCRHEMTVIFKDLKGFEFIVQPKNFDAGYCKGRCPPRYNPAHHHALLQSLIWKEDKRKVPRPCCAPSKLAELEILYFDENDPTKLKVSSWKNMRVLECACS
ncbi:bone morphogenetic protein 4 [Chelonus insularis]|uniref:bone morphogenetic protein 4 n=1 Tax=Chelonus insularis TaxID=460826 RepID=UPI00158C6EC4|nr:bone morphogenetic protein 4 [Chelonus insularis]XP_034947146.1 bone morphogenetic protein 4 [Chelonus insularis]